MSDLRRNYVVSVDSEDADPFVFGPYTRQRAERLAANFNARIEGKTGIGSEHGWLSATAFPIRNPGIRGIMAEFGL